MKKFSFLIAFLVFCSISYAQSPEYINYQAVLRDASQNLITSSSCNSCSVNVMIEVLETSTSSSSYTEIHTEAPNAYGLIGSEANKIEPKKTPLSSMSPVIVFRDDKPYLITGSPGGSTIITSVLQEILNILDFQMSLEESSKKSRIHFQHLPDILFHEKLDKSLIESLKKEKRLIKRKIGEIHSILLKEDGIEAFSDERRPDGKASSIYK